ncbi:MAG TPA: hypothetical protein VHP33_10355 [Polyangiaceae bacterium]|nr:hypothetical protein [Polyangiaceae bacterium]
MKSNRARVGSWLELNLLAAAVGTSLSLSSHALAQTPPTQPPAAPTAVPPSGPDTSAPAPGPEAAEAAGPAPTAPAAPPEPAPAPASTSVSEPPPPPGRDKLYERLEGGGWLGYGIQLDSEDTKPFGITLGLRGGAVLSNHLYLGLMLGMFAGQSDSAGYLGGYRYTVSLWQSQLAVEGGYDFDFGPITLRPVVGLGLNHTILSYTVSGGFYSETLNDTASTDLYSSLGGMAHLQLSKRIYGGLESRVTLATTDPLRSSLVIAASGGMMFD